MIYITGDLHRDFTRVFAFARKKQTTKEDILIVLGDVGINYYLDDSDKILKEKLQELPLTLFCIQGNHEERPENISSYKETNFLEGIVFKEDEYPNLLFAKDGEIYNFLNMKTLVIGGAYTIDKYYRIKYGHHWFKDEEPSEKTKQKVLEKIKKQTPIDVILTHTAPYKYLPREMFLEGVDQNYVDQKTEHFLDKVEELVPYKKWYCGHFHTDKRIDKIVFLYQDIVEYPK